MNFASLNSVKEKALQSAGLLTFSVENVTAKAATTGQAGFKAICDDDDKTVVTFWESTADLVLDEIAEGKFRVKPGVTVAADGGLIPAESKGKGFWS